VESLYFVTDVYIYIYVYVCVFVCVCVCVCNTRTVITTQNVCHGMVQLEHYRHLVQAAVFEGGAARGLMSLAAAAVSASGFHPIVKLAFVGIAITYVLL